MQPRRVLIDGFFLGKSYGFGRFIGELCRALDRAEDGPEIVVAVPERQGAAPPAFERLGVRMLPERNFIVWEQAVIPLLARRLGCDVVHFPYNTRALLTPGFRSVTTVHDVLFLDQDLSSAGLKDRVYNAYTRLLFRTAVGRSDAIVSVSDTTRRALEARGMRATTVYNTVDGFVSQPPAPSPAPRETGRPYALHRGGHNPHRNTGRVVAAFAAARRRIPDLELVVMGVPDGAARWGTGEDGAIRYLPRVPDGELARLYAGSRCLVATSTEEGFGLPIIEGFGFGTPVITSDLDPMREVAGGAALLVDPTDVDGIAAGIVRAVSDPAAGRDLVARGRERIKAFSAERVARAMLDVYAAAARAAP